jgi:hypothetical protein
MSRFNLPDFGDHLEGKVVVLTGKTLRFIVLSFPIHPHLIPSHVIPSPSHSISSHTNINHTQEAP